MLNIRRFLLLVVVALCSFAMVARAQVNTASVRGTIVDAGGAVMPGAHVTLHNDGTGIDRQAVANGTGEYDFEFVTIGTYTISVTRSGFNVQKREALTLSAAQVARIDLTMTIESANQAVVVTDQAPLMDVSTAQQTGELSAVAINQLPVAKQDWTSILQLMPGASTYGGPKSSAGGSITMNGLPPAGFNLTIDGTNATSNPEAPSFAFFGGPNLINTINNDAIAQVVMVKGIAPASIGGTMSGNVNIVTKSGSNQLHGSVYEINDLSTYDARNQFVTAAKGRPRSTINFFGGSLGGPILRDKLFGFISYGGARLSGAKVVSGAAPTPYFLSTPSESPAIYAPILAQFPHVDQPAGQPLAITATYNGTFSTKQFDGNGVIRFDYYLNPNNSFMVRYIRARPKLSAPLGILPINQNYTTGHSDEFNAAFTHVGSNWASYTRFGSNRIRYNRNFLGFGADLEEIVYSGLDSQGAENFTIAGRFLTGEEAVTYSHGHHNIEAGVIMQRQDGGRTDLNTASFSYSTKSNYVNNQPNGIVITFDLNPFNLHTTQYGAYLQDDWRLTSNLTVNLGVRYDYFTVPQEDTGRVFNRGVDPANPTLGPGFGPYRPSNSMYNADWNNFQPRAGFAWSVGPRSTVVRGGLGMFVNPHPLFGGPISEVQSNATTPFRITANQTQVAASGLQFPIPRSQYGAALTAFQTHAGFSPNFANTAINGNFPNPYSVQWMLGAEQALPLSSVLEVNYIGTRGVKLNMVDTKNLPDRTSGSAPVGSLGTFQYYYPGDSSNYHSLQVTYKRPMKRGLAYGVAYTWARNMSFGDDNLLLSTSPQDNNNIKADYGRTPFDIRHKVVANALWEIPFERWTGLHGRGSRLALGGWQISGIFYGATGLSANPINKSSALYPSDRPDVVAGQPRYLAGYRSALTTAGYNQHQYLNPCAFALPKYGGGDSRLPACLASLGLPASTDPFVPNPTSGSQTRPGNLGRNAIDLPSTFNFDASLSKGFDITEKVRLQLKGEAFNAFNHTNLITLNLNPNATNFGSLAAATPRTVQISARVTF